MSRMIYCIAYAQMYPFLFDLLLRMCHHGIKNALSMKQNFSSTYFLVFLVANLIKNYGIKFKMINNA